MSATSYLPDDFGEGYYPNNLFDGSLRYAYVEGVDGLGIGEEIIITFDDYYYISSVRWYPGYQRGYEDLGSDYPNPQIFIDSNAYPTELIFFFMDGTTVRSKLRGSVSCGTYVEMKLSEPVLTSGVIVKIADAQMGAEQTFEDTAIAEM